MAVWTFGGYSVCDLWEAKAELDPGDVLPDRANTVMIPSGQPCARGWLLMAYGSLSALDFDSTYDLTITDDAKRTTMLRGWLPVSAASVFDGKDKDEASLYLLQIADARYRLLNEFHAQLIHAQYNVRHPAWWNKGAWLEFGATDPNWYYADSIPNSSNSWSWDTMLHDMWSQLGGLMGTYPGLPFSPSGVPEDVICIGIPAWAAFCEQLDRCGLTIKADLASKTKPYAIVRFGQADAAADKLIAQAENANRKLYDAESIESIRAKRPDKVAVLFHHKPENYPPDDLISRRIPEFPGSDPENSGNNWTIRPLWPWYPELSNDNALNPSDAEFPSFPVTGGEPHVTQPIIDEMPMQRLEDFLFALQVIAPGPDALGNSYDALGELQTRATERQDSYLRHLRDPSGKRLRKEFSGVVPIAPGSTLKSITYRQDDDGDSDNDGGTRTEIRNYPAASQEIDDDGRWITPDSVGFATPSHAPDLNPTWPICPPRVIPDVLCRFEDWDPTEKKFDTSVQGLYGFGMKIWVVVISKTGRWYRALERSEADQCHALVLSGAPYNPPLRPWSPDPPDPYYLFVAYPRYFTDPQVYTYFTTADPFTSCQGSNGISGLGFLLGFSHGRFVYGIQGPWAFLWQRNYFQPPSASYPFADEYIEQSFPFVDDVFPPEWFCE